MASRALLALGAVLALRLLWHRRKKQLVYSSSSPRVSHSGLPSALSSSTRSGALSCGLNSTVLVCRDVQSCEVGVKKLLESKFETPLLILGFDVEWRPNREEHEPVQPVAVLQLSSGSVTLVVQVLVIGFLPECVTELMQNKRVLKVGVGAASDGLALQRSYEVDVRGCVEIELLLVRTMDCEGLKGFAGGTSLKSLCQFLLGVELDKSPELRCSDWSKSDLSEAQVAYAAADAYYSWAVCDCLLRMRAAHHGGRLDTAMFDGFMAGLVDARKEKLLLRQQQKRGPAESKTNTNTKKDRPSRFDHISKNLYDNYRVEGPGGEFMFTCDRKKRNWYLDRNLAALVEGKDNCIRLTFVPKGVGNQGSAFYENGLDNRCVVCGTLERLVRHNVIPHSYRKHFPLRIKSHSSHDVVLMCTGCHTKAQLHGDRLREEIAREMNIPLQTPAELVKVDPVMQKARNAAVALTGRQAARIPDEKKLVLRGNVATYFGCEESELTEDMLQQARDFTFRSILPQEDTHDALVVSAILEKEGIRGIHEFCRRWREHLLSTLQPKFLSEFWDVNFIKPNDPDLVPDPDEDQEDDQDQSGLPA